MPTDNLMYESDNDDPAVSMEPHQDDVGRSTHSAPMDIAPGLRVAIVTIACCINGKRFTALDMARRSYPECQVDSKVDDFKNAIGPEPDGFNLVCDGEEVLPCRENALKVWKSQPSILREAISEILELPNAKTLRKMIARIPALAECRDRGSL